MLSFITKYNPGISNKHLVILPGVYMAFILFIFRDYLQFFSVSFVVGIFTLIIIAERSERRSGVFFIPALIFIALGFLIPVKTILYFATVCSVFYMAENFGWKFRAKGILVAFLMSPVSEYFANIFSFPLRIRLSSFAAWIINQAEPGTRASGNIIQHKGQEFSVDPACMGLNMLITSFLVAIMLIAFYEKKTGKTVNAIYLLLFIIAVFLLNVCSNISRIVVLVIFGIAPGNPFHDVTGILCMVGYVILPSIGLARALVNRSGKVLSTSSPINHKPIQYSRHYLLIIAIVSASVYSLKADTFSKFSNAAHSQIAGYKIIQFKPGILKMENQNSLIYAKFIRGFYDTDHNPSICWKGSGYEFSQIKKLSIANTQVYAAVLKKDKDILYTAWWYSNGNDNTINNFSWRYNMLKGATNYAVINLTCVSEAELTQQAMTLLGKNILRPLFQQ